MNLFQMFFPLALLLAVSLVVGWLIPYRRERKEPGYDIEATIAHHREALSVAMKNAREAMKVAREANREIRSANRELQHLVDLRARDVELRSKAS